MKVRIEVSARHVHLSQKDLEKLFGKEFLLKKERDLSQKGEFASKSTVNIITKKNTIKNIRIVGPVRKNTQVELTQTEARFLGIKPPVEMSGILKNAVACTIVGPKGKIKHNHSVIAEKRHFHCDPKTAKKLNIKTGKNISIKISGVRGLIFNNVVTRVADNFVPAIHLDTDEANAAGVSENTKGEIVL